MGWGQLSCLGSGFPSWSWFAIASPFLGVVLIFLLGVGVGSSVSFSGSATNKQPPTEEEEEKTAPPQGGQRTKHHAKKQHLPKKERPSSAIEQKTGEGRQHHLERDWKSNTAQRRMRPSNTTKRRMENSNITQRKRRKPSSTTQQKRGETQPHPKEGRKAVPTLWAGQFSQLGRLPAPGPGQVGADPCERAKRNESTLGFPMENMQFGPGVIVVKIGCADFVVRIAPFLLARQMLPRCCLQRARSPNGDLSWASPTKTYRAGTRTARTKRAGWHDGDDQSFGCGCFPSVRCVVIILDCSPLAQGLRFRVSKITMFCSCANPPTRRTAFHQRLHNKPFPQPPCSWVQRVEVHHRAPACCKFKLRVEAQWLAS